MITLHVQTFQSPQISEKIDVNGEWAVAPPPNTNKEPICKFTINGMLKALSFVKICKHLKSHMYTTTEVYFKNPSLLKY